MKIQFTSDEISEYAVGNFHFKNDGEPFDAIGDLGAELLKAKAVVPGTGLVNVFEPAVADGVKHFEMTEKSLMKLKKADLLEIAAGVDAGATEDNNKSEIVEKILATQED